ncbi:4-amino-4-deoxychorismate lyase, partial [Pseudomonas syringae pv. maculicola]
GQPLLLERHLQRLENGCQRLAIAIDQVLVRTEMTRFAAELGDGVMKLILTRGDSQRGYAPAPDTQSRRILLGSPAP